jgi:hypothetical protein
LACCCNFLDEICGNLWSFWLYKYVLSLRRRKLGQRCTHAQILFVLVRMDRNSIVRYDLHEQERGEKTKAMATMMAEDLQPMCGLDPAWRHLGTEPTPMFCGRQGA